MKLQDLCEVFCTSDFPGLGVQAHPNRSSVLEARAAVTAAVQDDELLLDCVARELAMLENHELRRSLVPFHIISDLGIAFAFGYHPPGARPGPHEHTAWTITAVCRNELEMRTWDRDESYRRRELVPKNRFQAVSGRVGFVYDPCIHEPRNVSADWSMSLHVISPLDGERPTSETESPPPGLDMGFMPSPEADQHPYRRVQAARQRQTFVRELHGLITSTGRRQARDLYGQCLRLGPPGLRRAADGRDHIEQSWTLTRTHPGLALDHHRADGSVTLYAQTPAGASAEIVIDDVACAAIELAAREQSFEVRDLPGALSSEERRSIGEALERTGLFTRSRQ